MKRIQRKRVKGYKTPENTKYVGRPTKFGNPFKLSPDGWILYHKKNKLIGNPWCYWSDSGGFTIKDVIELYGKWIDGELIQDKRLPLPPNINELIGFNLSCFCSLKNSCHVDEIIKRLI